MCVVCGCDASHLHTPHARPLNAAPVRDGNVLLHTATHCNTLQHTATHCNTLQHTAISTHCSTLQHSAALLNILQHTTQLQHGTWQHTAALCTKLQHLQHTATHYTTASRHLSGMAMSCISRSVMSDSSLAVPFFNDPSFCRRHLQCVAVCCSVLQRVAA